MPARAFRCSNCGVVLGRMSHRYHHGAVERRLRLDKRRVMTGWHLGLKGLEKVVYCSCGERLPIPDETKVEF